MKTFLFVIIVLPSLVLASDHKPTINANITVCLRNYLFQPDSIDVDITNLYNNDVINYTNVTQTPQCQEYLVTDIVALKIWNITLIHEDGTPQFVDALDLSGRGTYLIFTIYGNHIKIAKVWVNDTADDHDRYNPDYMDALGYDQSYMVVNNTLFEEIRYDIVSSECYKCSPKTIGTIYPGALSFITVGTQFRLTYFFTLRERNCKFNHHFLEHSRVDVTLSNHSVNHTLCNVSHHIAITGQDPYLSILFVAIVLCGSFIIWFLVTHLYSWARSRGWLHLRKHDRVFNKDIGNPETIQKSYGGTVNSESEQQLLLNPNENDSKTKKRRLKSLDTVRGLSLMVMIFVNYGGGGYWFFSHSAWNGVTVADLVFPWFVWIMGVSLVFSFRGRKNDPWYLRLYQILRRTVILMGLGLFLNNGFRLTHWRIPGVLQRFAVTYFVVALTELLSSYVYDKFKLTKNVSYISDLTNNWIQWLVTVVCEILWVSITFLLEYGDCKRGYLGPGGVSEYGNYSNCTGGVAGYIDQKILGINHIYQHPTCKSVYDTGPYDPEGILGSLNSIVICFLGVQAGRILVYHKGHWSRILRFIAWGLLLSLIAVGLCEGKRDEGLIPLNKNLWSLSFILLMAGTGYLLLTLFYVLIDMARIWNGAPFIYPGMNSIMVYVGSELLEGMFPFGWYNMKHDHLQYLSSNIISVSLWCLIAYYWFAIDFFVKI